MRYKRMGKSDVSEHGSGGWSGERQFKALGSWCNNVYGRAGGIYWVDGISEERRIAWPWQGMISHVDATKYGKMTTLPILKHRFTTRDDGALRACKSVQTI
jgi:hypothetical protein